MRDGEPTNVVDPFGPVAAWENWGRTWLGNAILQELQSIYPNPPLVVFLNNNEGGKLYSAEQLGSNADRFNALHPGVTSLTERTRLVREGYTERYSAMFAAARSVLTDGWKDKVRFVAYNAWGDAITGASGGHPIGDGTDLWFDPVSGKGFRNWAVFDGAMPEYYDNQWQGSKTDHSPWSPQTEAFNLAAIQDMVFAERPDYYFASIAWEGGVASTSFNKVNGYITGGYGRVAQRWDAARYEGFHQFGLWTMRPREYREFRGGDPRDPYNEATWQALLGATERVWNTPVLEEYWRFGKLVPSSFPIVPYVNDGGGHFFGNNSGWPQWLKDLPRWFLLESSANPPYSTWPASYLDASGTKLRVLAMALVLGDSPNRRWLVYAHAPLGAVAGSTVNLPGYGSLTLDHISRSGSFFEVRESGRTVTPLVRGVAELLVTPAQTRVATGESTTIAGQVGVPLDAPFTSYEWRIDGQTVSTSSNLVPLTTSFSTPGPRVIALEAETADGRSVIGEAFLHVGPAPSASLAIELPLDRSFSWRGLWGSELVSAATETAQAVYRPVSYSLTPNAGDMPVDVSVQGGSFVDDGERGRVFRLAQIGDGVTLPASDRTTLLPDGPTNLDIEFWFKADSLSGLQGLFAQGYGSDDGGGGYNIYLQGDQLYAGSWSLTGRSTADDWTGNWISTEAGVIQAGRWHHVRLVLEGATDTLQNNKLSLYVDDALIGTGPAVRVKRHWTHPRLGWLGDTRLPAGPSIARAQFVGALDAFRYRNAVATPEEDLPLARAINAGGTSLVGGSGRSYEADSAYTGGTVRVYASTAPLSASEDSGVYRSMREGASFSYALPLTASGTYKVRLKFAELEYSAVGQRVFSVSAEGQTKISDLDLFETAGRGVGYDVDFTVPVTDGTLNLQFASSSGLAVVSAVAVWTVSTTSTDSGTHSLYANSDIPSASATDGVAYELGLRFTPDRDGEIRAIRYYRPAEETGTHVGRLWASDGTLLATGTFTGESASGWQQVSLATPLPVFAGQTYTVSVNCNAYFGYTSGAYGSTARVRGPLTAPAENNGVYGTPGTRPTQTHNGSDYFRDVVFAPRHTLYGSTDLPATSASDGQPIELGVKFKSSQAGEIRAIRYYRPAEETGTHTGRLWNESGTLLATVSFTNETASGWQEARLSTPVAIVAGQTYTVSVNCNTYFAFSPGAYTTDRVRGPLTAPATDNGVYTYTVGTRPTNTYNASDYLRDVVFTPGTTLTAMQQWRIERFGTIAEENVASNGSDPDGDGVPNLLEYAFDTDPLSPEAGARYSTLFDDHSSSFGLTFIRQRADLRYEVQSSTDLKNWSTIATNPGDLGGEAVVEVPPSSNSHFLRLTVSPM